MYCEFWESRQLAYTGHLTLRTRARFSSRVCVSLTLKVLSELWPHNRGAHDFQPLFHQDDS